MEVKVVTKCGRCGKTDEKSVQMDEAQKLVDEINQKTTALVNLKSLAESLDPLQYPTVILFVNKGGVYEVKTLDNLCNKPDAKRNKGCVARTTELLADIFELKTGEPKVRKARTPKDPNAPPKEKGKKNGK